MKSHRYIWLTYLCVSAALVGLPFVGGTAHADPISPGFDYFLTPPGGAVVDLGFGPIPLEGVPLPNMALGLTDTVVARMDPGPPAGGTGIIDIELVALHLKSVGPVDFDPTPGVMLGDLHITIDSSDRFWTGTTPKPDGSGSGPSFFDLPTLPNPPSIGNMSMAHGGPGPHTGASMSACFGDPAGCAGIGSAPLGVPGGGIFATAIAVVPGGDPSDPLDVFAIMPAPAAVLGSTGLYRHTTENPVEYGGIILTSIVHVGPHPGTQPVPDDAVPEPTSALLAMCAVLGCGMIGRRRHSA